MLDDQGPTNSRGVENGDDLEHIGQEKVVEEVRVAFLKAIEVDVLLEPGGLGPQLGQDAQTVVGVEEVRRDAGSVGEGSERHGGQENELWGRTGCVELYICAKAERIFKRGN